MSRNQRHSITFRLDDRYLKKLDDDAAKHGISAHQRARQFVIERLDEQQQERTMEKLIETLSEVRQLRGDMAEAVEWIVKKLGAA